MAVPVPTYLTTQTATQTAFTVPFGLLSFVNAAIAAAVARGEFNVTVDCSLFITEDVSNLRIYLDSLGYHVDFAKNTGEKSLNIDWGRFLDIPGTEVVVDQGTTPWIVAGTVTANQGTTPWVVSGTISTSPDVNVHDGAGVAIGSSGDSLNVDVTNFPAIQPVSQSGVWTTDRTWTLLNTTDSVNVGNFPATQPVSGTVTALQGTSPWVVSGTITTSPDVNVHDSAGNSISSTGTSLNVNVTDFPAIQPVSGTVTALQGTSPWVVSGTISTSPDVNIHDSAGNALSSTGTSLNTNITNFPATVAVTQSTSPWVVSGTVTANAGTGNFTVVQPTGTNLHTVVDSGSITVNNGAGASAVNIQDGGNSITVDGTITANQGTSPWLMSGFDANGATANPNPIIVGGRDTSGVVRSITALETFAVESLCVINVPVLSYLTSQNKVYSVALSVNAASAGTDNPLVYIRNPSGSGKTLHILKVIGGTAVANVADTYKLTANPTVSVNGTSQTPVSRNVGGGAGAAIALVTTLPTISAIGSVLQNAVGGQNSQTVEIVIEEYSTIVQPDNAILVTADPSSNNRASAVTVIWAEI